MAKILIVEDEEHIRRMTAAALQLGGHECRMAADGEEAEQLVQQETFDVILLDIMLPKEDGFSVMEKIRDSGASVIFLSALSEVEDKVKGLRLGAEDYIVKPFEPLELLARIEVILRRRGKQPHMLSGWGIVQDLDSHTVTLDGKQVALSPKEFDLLKVFLSHPGIALSREKLLAMVWGYEFAGETRTVDIHVQRLRQKLNLSGCLVTIPRIGYRLEKEK